MGMLKRISTVIFVFSLFSAFSNPATDSVPSPWFTGPLLGSSGSTYPAGHISFQPYLFYTDNFGHYNNVWKRQGTLKARTWNPTMSITMGLTKRTELHFGIPYFFHTNQGASDRGFGDVSVSFGYYLLQDAEHSWRPDLKLTIAEAFPVGRYDNLDPGLNGTDSLGAGAYQTALGANFQKRWYLGLGHFLRARWDFIYTMPTKVNLHGFNAYGGATDTNGKITLGNNFSSDMAFEYTLTRNWVPAIDFLYKSSANGSFTGNSGMTSVGLPAPISTEGTDQFSVAPAIEYNFNARFGAILGVWFSVAEGIAKFCLRCIFFSSFDLKGIFLKRNGILILCFYGDRNINIFFQNKILDSIVHNI